jgi:prepilin-type N-terminal cleavage/methylation domain-containing protein
MWKAVSSNMKKPLGQQSIAGFTLVEMMITTVVFAITGGMVFFFLNSGMNLYAKNTAVNAAHQQARAGVDQMLANIHAAVSIPQLVDQNLTALPPPGIGPAAGINFQKFDSGPYLLATAQNVPSTQTYVTVFAPNLDASQNVAGMRFNIPSHQIELDIQSITVFGSYRIIGFGTTAVGTDIIVNDNDPNGKGNGNGNGNGTSNIIGFITRRVSYAIAGASPYYELRYYPTNNLQNYKVIARNVTSPPPGQAPTPFKVLFNQAGGADFRSVAAVDLSTAEPQYASRGYAAVNMFIDSYIPFRSKLTISQ